MHSDAMNYAKRGNDVKMSTCSEVVLADVEEVEFESHCHLAEFKVAAENVRSVIEEPVASALATSTADKADIGFKLPLQLSTKTRSLTILSSDPISLDEDVWSNSLAVLF